MPRLSHTLLRTAWNKSPLLPILLKSCRTLPAASNELRWLREHVKDIGRSALEHERLLETLCRRRGAGEPLQYLIGSQPFGSLDILCKSGVLIPRPETEAYTVHLCSLIKSGEIAVSSSPRILDICTGTGCIPLLLHSELSSSFPDLEITGIDISSRALTLSRRNLKFNHEQGYLTGQALSQVSFVYHNALLEPYRPSSKPNIVISNPPYISEEGFSRSTERSVRHWEPKLALVPPDYPTQACLSEDIFYPQILKNALVVEAEIVLMEVGDLQQAVRVAEMAIKHNAWTNVEIWRDWPDQASETEEHLIAGKKIAVKGQGNGRSVLCWS